MRPSLRFLGLGGQRAAWTGNRTLARDPHGRREALKYRPFSSFSDPHGAPPGPHAELDMAAVEREMVARAPQTTPDVLTPTPSRLLDLALSDVLPLDRFPAARAVAGPAAAAYLPPGHHLVHFPLALAPAALCPDGTDPYHSPGVAAFARRVWAGGSLAFEAPLAVDGRPAQCHERILGARAAGPPAAAKIFVDVARDYSPAAGPGLVRERRTLVFQRALAPAEARASTRAPARIVKPPWTPTVSHTLTPTARLLFQYSALSYNAHAIHYDAQYCREVEGHRAPLVHGPLSLTLMLRVVDAQLRGGNAVVHEFSYSHLAPLYVDEPMTVHAMPAANGRWQVWITNAQGGLCARGVCTTRTCPTVSGSASADPVAK